MKIKKIYNTQLVNILKNILNDMMTLEEAIRHCQEKSCGNSECAKEHKQLGEWLVELKQRREQEEPVSEKIVNNDLTE